MEKPVETVDKLWADKTHDEIKRDLKPIMNQYLMYGHKTPDVIYFDDFDYCDKRTKEDAEAMIWAILILLVVCVVFVVGLLVVAWRVFA